MILHHDTDASAVAGLVAILRGLLPDRADAVGDVLYAAGFRAVEVPLNSPAPFESIARLTARLPKDCQVGAGTVLSVEDVQRTFDVRGSLIVSPNCDPEVIAATLRLGMRSLPGIATPTEAFAALRAGTRELKLFPAASCGPAHLRALRSVLPRDVAVYAVGGVGPAEVPDWIRAGVDGFGFGSELFRPEYDIAAIARRAQAIAQAVRDARQELVGAGAPG